VQLNVEILNPDGNVDLFVERGFCPNNLLTSSYSSTNGGTTNELIIVATNSLPRPLSAGTWAIAVANRDNVPVSYTIRVTEILASQIIRLTNAVPYTNTITGLAAGTVLPVEYYVFNVSTGAVRAQFEILQPDGNVNLIARKNLPVPTFQNTSLLSSNGGASDELIVLFTNSAPVALSPGDWFLTVINPTTNSVTYAIVATEYNSLGANINLGGFTLTSNLLCLTWTNTLWASIITCRARPISVTPPGFRFRRPLKRSLTRSPGASCSRRPTTSSISSKVSRQSRWIT